jgi:serine/threonine-protein kinase
MSSTKTEIANVADAAPESEGASDSRRDPLVGSVVNGKYQVHEAIARGGMGRIYYATQVPIERPVALKVVQADGEHEAESQFLKRFLQEASILAKLQHPNVVTLFDYGKIEGSHVEQYFIAMEFLAGETLTHRFKTRGRLSAGETLVLGRQITRGLREAHKRGIVHRDLKPSNIILVPEGDGSEIVKLVDFGIGKVLGRPGDQQDLTQDGVFVGTPRYMAPEQFEGAAYPASDFYALGTILFQALAGRLPFVGSTMAEFMIAKLARDVPSIREVAPDAQIPDNLELLVQHLLERQPEARPSMDQLNAYLMACEEEVFGTAHSMRQHNSSGPHSFAQTGSTGAYALRQTGSGPLPFSQTGSGPHSHGVPQPTGSTPRSFGQATGSGPHLPAHQMDPGSMLGYGGERLRVPHTVIQPIPGYAQMTPPPTASSAHPPMPTMAEPSRPSRARLVIALAVLPPLLLGAGLFWKMRTPAASTTETTPSGSATTGAGSSANPTARGPASAAFTLTIDSAPPGATVSEGENALGTTPVKVAIDRASVASAPRTFVVMKDGFAPSHVVQGPSTDNVRSVVSLAALAPEAPSAVKSRPPGGAKTGGQAATAPKPTSSATGPGLDIRLKR